MVGCFCPPQQGCCKNDQKKAQAICCLWHKLCTPERGCRNLFAQKLSLDSNMCWPKLGLNHQLINDHKSKMIWPPDALDCKNGIHPQSVIPKQLFQRDNWQKSLKLTMTILSSGARQRQNVTKKSLEVIGNSSWRCFKVTPLFNLDHRQWRLTIAVSPCLEQSMNLVTD